LYAHHVRKGDQNKRDNYRGITLLSCIYKVLSHIISNALTEYAEKIIGDYQMDSERTMEQSIIHTY
jgi:Reverse transcriptase (RNA-dependent DNA polymerase).